MRSLEAYLEKSRLKCGPTNPFTWGWFETLHGLVEGRGGVGQGILQGVLQGGPGNLVSS